MENKEKIIKLIREGELNTADIAKQFGISSESVRSIKSHVTMGTYDNISATNNLVDAVETTFGLEKDLQNALRQNIEQLENGLTIIDEGKEKITDAGRIDILAKDKNDIIVVIELKAGKAKPDSITQILAYMGTFNEKVRGILVASDFHEKIKFAIKALENIKLKKYSFKFSFTDF